MLHAKGSSGVVPPGSLLLNHPW